MSVGFSRESGLCRHEKSGRNGPAIGVISRHTPVVACSHPAMRRGGESRDAALENAASSLRDAYVTRDSATRLEREIATTSGTSSADEAENAYPRLSRGNRWAPSFASKASKKAADFFEQTRRIADSHPTASYRQRAIGPQLTNGTERFEKRVSIQAGKGLQDFSPRRILRETRSSGRFPVSCQIELSIVTCIKMSSLPSTNLTH